MRRMASTLLYGVTPAEAGVQTPGSFFVGSMPAFAGMTGKARSIFAPSRLRVNPYFGAEHV